MSNSSIGTVNIVLLGLHLGLTSVGHGVGVSVVGHCHRQSLMMMGWEGCWYVLDNEL